MMTAEQFDRKQSHVRQALQAEMLGNQKAPLSNHKVQFNDRTGWLPGSLSYPWVLIALSLIPVFAVGKAII